MPLEQATTKQDHMRVRLRYVTDAPTTEAAIIMADHLGVPGPYLEEVSILIPVERAFSLLEAYTEPFELLRANGAVPATATLHSFRIGSGDQPRILAYVIP